MLRFTMPDPDEPGDVRKEKLISQFDGFLKSDALRNLLSALETDIEGVREKYNARRKADGGVMETQELRSFRELDTRKEELYPLFRELGFFDINKPVSPGYTRILILGASLSSTWMKTKCSAVWVIPSVRSVDALTCYRPLNPKERVNSAFQTDADTEFGAAAAAMRTVYGLFDSPYEDSFNGDRNLNRISCIRNYSREEAIPSYRIFAAPSSQPEERRADSGDTLRFYLDHAGISEGETLLAVTSNRYCNRQFLQLAYQLMTEDVPLGLDIIGNYGDTELVTAQSYDPTQYLQDVIAMIDWTERFSNLV